MELEHARLTAGRYGERRHRNLASSLEATEKGTLGRHGERGRDMVKRLARGGDGPLVSPTGGDPESPLAPRAAVPASALGPGAGTIPSGGNPSPMPPPKPRRTSPAAARRMPVHSLLLS